MPPKQKKSRATTGPAAKKIIDAYIQRKNPALKQLATDLRRLIKKTLPTSRESVNPWGIPTFDLHGPVAFIMIGKNHITFGFTRGTSLTNQAGLLEGTGKNLRHIKLKTANQLTDKNLQHLLSEAATLNHQTPLTSSMRPSTAGLRAGIRRQNP